MVSISARMLPPSQGPVELIIAARDMYVVLRSWSGMSVADTLSRIWERVRRMGPSLVMARVRERVEDLRMSRSWRTVVVS